MVASIAVLSLLSIGESYGQRKKSHIKSSSGKVNQAGALQANTRSSKRGSSGRIVPRSVSRNYVVKKKKSPYSSFRPKKQWEKAYKGDIAGKPFQTKSGTSTERVIQKPRGVRSISMMRGEGRAYQGKSKSDERLLSVTRPSEQAWKNSISGHKLRLPNNRGPAFLAGQFISKEKRGDQAYNGDIKGRYLSISKRGEVAGRKLTGKKLPGAGTLKGVVFKGNIKAIGPVKGGGSITRNGWNNNGQSLTKLRYSEQVTQIAAFQGNIKAVSPIKGGGSITKNGWNNNGQSLTKLRYSEQVKQTATFQGHTKVTWEYKKNPSSANGALKSIARSRVAISASNYQGNIKMNKNKINGTHPSYRYLRHQNSSMLEKDKNFNIKLLFTKIFRKNEAQPDNITEKEKAPRFDRRERDIWYD